MNAIFLHRGQMVSAMLMLILSCYIIPSCKKQNSYLDVKSANSEVVPSTLTDYQAILDNSNVMNGSYSVLGLLGSDNYYLASTVYNALTVPGNTAYIWAIDIWEGGASTDWNSEYKIIEYANVALDGIQTATIDTSSQSSYSNVKGSALFYRAFAFYNLATLFCKPYSAATASSDLGIPLRLSSNINIIYPRATVEQTCNQIISDLKEAVGLLPNIPLYVTRPSSVAANALLSKVYLLMGDYVNAKKYSTLALTANSSLIDFNSSIVNPSSIVPFPQYPEANPEIIFYAAGDGYPSVWSRGYGIIDSVLYASYDTNDLRRLAFYKILNGNLEFAGSYNAYSRYDFSGIANNEIYLIRAESNARQNDLADALSDLNLLLSKRYKTGTYKLIRSANQDSVLGIILNERRKELPFTANIRWEDLRRFAGSPYAVTLTRIVNGEVFTLPPGDPRYVYPIPDNEIQLSGIQQNTR